MQNEAKMAEERKKAMKAKVREEKVKQIDKLQKLAEEQERLQRLQKQKAEEALTAAFLLKEKKQQTAEEERSTKEFLKKEKEKEELKQKKLTEQFLEQERIKEEKKQRQLTEQLLERERLEKERMRKNKTTKSTKTSGISPTRPDVKRKATKPTTTEQEAERQKLFSALNDVVLNGKKPSKGKDLGGTMRKTKRLKQYLARLRKTIESQWTCIPNVELFNMRDNVHALCVGKEGMMKNPAPLRVPLSRKEKKRLRKRKGYVHAVIQKGIEHKSVHGIRQNPWSMNLLCLNLKILDPPYVLIVGH